MDVSKVKFQPRMQPDKKTSRLRAGKVPEWLGGSAANEHHNQEQGDEELGRKKAVSRGDGGRLAFGKVSARPASSFRGQIDEAEEPRHLDEAEIVQLSSSDLESDEDEDSEPRGRRPDSQDDSDSDGSVPGDVVIINAVDEPEVDDDKITAVRASIRDKLKARQIAPAVVEALPFDSAEVPKARRGLYSDEDEELEDHEDEDVARAEPASAVKPSRNNIGRRGSLSSSSMSGSEASSDEESEEEPLMMPVFRPKDQRGTILELEAQEAEEERKYQERLKALEQRKIESKHMVADIIKREEAEQKAVKAEEDDERFKPDDNDDPDQFDMDMRAWAIRELTRLKTEKQRKEEIEAEARETERRRNLTDEERAAEDRELEKQGLKVFTKEKKSMKFLQKYRHKGVFYMDESSLKDKSDVRLRSIHEASGMDEFDRANMPKVLQVRGDDFGKRGRTKWTHLTAEDTTFNAMPIGWNDKSNPFQDKINRKRAGMGDINTAGRVVRGKRAEDH